MNKRLVALIAILVLLFPLLAACGPEEEAAGTTPTARQDTSVQATEPVGADTEPTEAPSPTTAPQATVPVTDATGVATVGVEGTAPVGTTVAEATQPAPEGTPGVEPTVKPAASQEGQLTIWADEVRAPLMRQLGEDFTAEYEVPVVVQELGFGDIRDQLKLAGPAGEGPDLIVGAHDWLGELVTNGLLEPIDLGEKADQIDEVALNAFTYEGQLYGLPYGTEAIALYYNKDLVPNPPTTWDELKQTAQQLQDDGEVEQGYVLQQGDPYHAYPIFSGHGGYVFGRNEDGSYNPEDLGLDNPGSIAAAREISEMVESGLLRKDITYDIMMSMFAEGQSAMFMTGPWALPQVRESGINYGVAQIPTMEETPRPFVGAQGFMVNAFGAEKILAQAFLTEFIATDETMQQLFEVDPRSPAWLPVKETIDDPDLAAFAESAANGDPMPAIPQMSAVWDSWGNAVTLLFQQQGTPEQVMQDAARAIREQLAGE